jgi:hypothetical protein
MPVIVVTAPALPPASEVPALARVAAVVAQALSLRPMDVVVTTVHAAATVTGDSPIDAWPVVVLHGRARDPAGMAAAETAAQQEVSRIWSVPTDQVWVQWLVR